MASQPALTTVELLSRVRGGDRRAFAAVLSRLEERMLNRVRLLMGPKARRVAESGDYLQGVLVELLASERRSLPADEEGFLRWTTTIARNNIRDDLRRKRESAFGSFSASLSLADGAHDPVSGEAAREEAVHRLALALEELPEDYRRVIELRNLDGLKPEEVARAFGRSKDAVRRLHQRAMIALGRILGRSKAGDGRPAGGDGSR